MQDTVLTRQMVEEERLALMWEYQSPTIETGKPAQAKDEPYVHAPRMKGPYIPTATLKQRMRKWVSRKFTYNDNLVKPRRTKLGQTMLEYQGEAKVRAKYFYSKKT